MCSISGLQVSEHKTKSTYGNAFVIFDKDTCRQFLGYLYTIRNSEETSGKFFLTERGSPIENKHVFQRYKFFHVLFASYTTASIRKAIITTIHAEANESDKRDLRSLMCHRLETANKFYYINKRRQDAIRAALLLKNQRQTNTKSAANKESSTSTSSKEATLSKEASTHVSSKPTSTVTKLVQVKNSCKYIARINME